MLAPDGRLLVVDMTPHDREGYRQQMGHVWLGFSETQIREWLAAAGLDRIRFRPLATDSRSQGPTLFVASARRPAGRAASNVQTSNGRRRR